MSESLILKIRMYKIKTKLAVYYLAYFLPVRIPETGVTPSSFSQDLGPVVYINMYENVLSNIGSEFHRLVLREVD